MNEEAFEGLVNFKIVKTKAIITEQSPIRIDCEYSCYNFIGYNRAVTMCRLIDTLYRIG